VENLVIIGASTGGTKVLTDLFASLPRLRAAVVVVQHMPQYINQTFANSLNKAASMPVKIARENDMLESGSVLLAPSGAHLKITPNRRVHLSDDPPVNFVRPSIDVTMQSVKRMAPDGRLVGVVLTGMGRDGADGLSYLKSIGGITIAQDKASSAVFGMPSEAFKTGKVDHVLPPLEIARLLARLVGE
jgi:two-component system, chemotaxis family, protein-glutamate methylesterase/glutaminase